MRAVGSWTLVNPKRLLVPDPAKERLLLKPAFLPAEGSNLQRKRSQPTSFKFLWRLETCPVALSPLARAFCGPSPKSVAGGGKEEVEGVEPTLPIGDWNVMWTWAGMLNPIYRERTYIWEQKTKSAEVLDNVIEPPLKELPGSHVWIPTSMR